MWKIFANKPQTVSWRTERMLQGHKRDKKKIISTSPKLWCRLTKKNKWYCPVKLDNRLSQNVQDIGWSHNVHRENLEILERGIDSKRKMFSWGKIQGGIFQEDTLSPLLFIIAMMPLNHIFRKCTGWYKPHKLQENINHLMYMEDIKLFAKMIKNPKP